MFIIYSESLVQIYEVSARLQCRGHSRKVKKDVLML